MLSLSRHQQHTQTSTAQVSRVGHRRFLSQHHHAQHTPDINSTGAACLVCVYASDTLDTRMIGQMSTTSLRASSVHTDALDARMIGQMSTTSLRASSVRTDTRMIGQMSTTSLRASSVCTSLRASSV